MDADSFRRSNISQLQEFLKERGVSALKLNKVHLVKLCEAVNHLDLPKNPDYINISPSNDVIRKLESLGCSDLFTMMASQEICLTFQTLRFMMYLIT